MQPSVILINPWIYDFAAYDMWSKPLGLLYLAGYLRRWGFRVHLIDCLDVHHPGISLDPTVGPPTRRIHGTGKFPRKRVPTPPALAHVTRRYSRYGVPPALIEDALRRVPNPSAILVTSLMTYWYPGVREAVSLARLVHPDTPVLLGGIYARLCPDHAHRVSGADRVITGHTPREAAEALAESGIRPPQTPSNTAPPPYPAFDLLTRLDYVCLLTSRGCPYRCRYCASHFLDPRWSRRDAVEVLDEIDHWHTRYGVTDFAFYDDALLVGFDSHLAEVLEGVMARGLTVRFHTPNAVHAREVTREAAALMFEAGFKTIRLGLETADFSPHRDLDDKLEKGDFERAVRHLLDAGFTSPQIGAYILMGLPGQDPDSVSRTIETAAAAGAVPMLAEYSPIPQTALWEKARLHSTYDLASEPLFHNNSLLPCWDDEKRDAAARLKSQALALRRRLAPPRVEKPAAS